MIIPVYLIRQSYASYYQYRKALRDYRNHGYIIRKVCGGVACFETLSDLEVWLAQR